MTIEELIASLSSTLVLHTTTTLEVFDALTTKDDNVIYFITDTGLVYKGDTPMIGLRDVSATVENTDTSATPSLTTLYYEVTLYKSGSNGGNVQFTCPTTDALAAVKTALESSISGVQVFLNNHINTFASDETLAHVKLSDATDSELDVGDGVAATPKAVKSALDIAKEYADGLIAVNDAMVLKGTIGDTEDGADVSALPTTNYKTGWTYIVVTAGTYAGNVCEIGDKIMCVNDYNTNTASDEDWSVFQANIDGAVTSADQLTDGNVIVGAGGNSVKALDNGGSKLVLTIDSETLKPVWADNIAQGIENPTRLTGTMQRPQQGWVRIVVSNYTNGGRLYINNIYTASPNRELIMDVSFSHGLYEPQFNILYSPDSAHTPLFSKLRILRKEGNSNILELYYQITNTNTIYFTYDMAHYSAYVSLPLINVPDLPEEGYTVYEYDLVNGVQSNLPYVSTSGLVAPTLGNGERTMDVEDIIARNSINAISAGFGSITQLRTGDSNYPYAFINAISPLAITFDNTEVYGLSIAKSESTSYTYNGVEYPVTNPNASYAASVFLIQDSDNMFLKGTTYPFNICNIAKSTVTVGRGRILAARVIVEGVYELIVNQQNTTIIEYPSVPTLRMFKKSNSGNYSGSYSVASGYNSVASGDYSVASGRESIASGYYSIASGQNSIANGVSSVASGSGSIASGNYSVASSYISVASGDYSVASGAASVASGDYSTALNRRTKATGTSQTVVGQYNDTDDNAYFIVGNGTSDTDRSNAMKVSKTGIVTANGYVGDLEGNATTADTADKVANDLIIKFDGGTTEGTNKFTFNGSASKTVNITPEAIGAYYSGSDIPAGNITGILPVEHGGTGNNTFKLGNLLEGNGANAILMRAISTTIPETLTNDNIGFIPTQGAVSTAITDALTEVLNVMVWQSIGG